MPISSRFVVQSTIVLLAVGFLTLLGHRRHDDLARRARAGLFRRGDRGARHAQRRRSSCAAPCRPPNRASAASCVTGNEIYLAPYDSAKALAERQLEIVEAGARALRRQPRPCCGGSRPSIGEKFDEMDQTIALKNDRRDAEALAMLRTNRGKALMDEANVFLSGIIRAADERLTDGRRRAARQCGHAALGVDRRRHRHRPGGGRRHRHRRCATRARSRRRATRSACSTPASRSG